MKKKAGLLFKTILFIILFAACLFGVMLITQRKASYEKNALFFEEAKKEHLDVLFLGSSHVINGINPITLYEDYGFTSYNLAGHGSIMQETYWQLIRALDYCKPEYVVVDCYMLEKNYQYLDVCDENTSPEEVKESIEHLHLNMDAYPLSKLKMAAVKDLIQDPDIQKEFLFDFMLYHNRWTELSKNDFGRINGTGNKNNLMGAEMRYGVKTDVDVYEQCQEGEVLPEHTVCEEYLMKIIDECQRDGIGVLLVYLPFSATTEDQIAANTAEQVAQTYNVPCINMLKTEDIIDEATDLNDHGHLNVAGAGKVTRSIGEWLSANTELTDHRGEAGFEEWDARSGEFNEEVNDILMEGTDLRTELSLLGNENVSSIIFINNESPAFDDEGIMHLVSGISGTEKINEAAFFDGPYILIDDKGSGNKYEAAGEEVLENVPTSIGDLIFIPIEKRFRLLYPSEDESINFLYDDNHLAEDIQILLYDNDSGDILQHLYYTSQELEYLCTY